MKITRYAQRTERQAGMGDQNIEFTEKFLISFSNIFIYFIYFSKYTYGIIFFLSHLLYLLQFSFGLRTFVTLFFYLSMSLNVEISKFLIFLTPMALSKNWNKNLLNTDIFS